MRASSALLVPGHVLRPHGLDEVTQLHHIHVPLEGVTLILPALRDFIEKRLVVEIPGDGTHLLDVALGGVEVPVGGDGKDVTGVALAHDGPHQLKKHRLRRAALLDNEGVGALKLFCPAVEKPALVLTQVQLVHHFSRLGKFDSMGGTDNIFKQLVCCADCKRPLVRYKNVSHGKKMWYTFICPTHASDPDACPKKAIREDKLSEIVLDAIKSQVALAVRMDAVIREINRTPEFCREVEKARSRVTNARRTLKRCRSLYDSLYQNYVEGLMDEDEYISLRQRYKEQAAEAERIISALEAEKANSKQYTSENLFLQAFTRFQSCDTLTRDMLTALIERVYISGDDTVEIIFKYADEYKALCDFVERSADICE